MVNIHRLRSQPKQLLRCGHCTWYSYLRLLYLLSPISRFLFFPSLQSCSVNSFHRNTSLFKPT